MIKALSKTSTCIFLSVNSSLCVLYWIFRFYCIIFSCSVLDTGSGCNVDWALSQYLIFLHIEAMRIRRRVLCGWLFVRTDKCCPWTNISQAQSTLTFTPAFFSFVHQIRIHIRQEREREDHWPFLDVEAGDANGHSHHDYSSQGSHARNQPHLGALLTPCTHKHLSHSRTPTYTNITLIVIKHYTLKMSMLINHLLQMATFVMNYKRLLQGPVFQTHSSVWIS